MLADTLEKQIRQMGAFDATNETFAGLSAVTCVEEACQRCYLRQLCLPLGLKSLDLVRLASIVKVSASIPRGKHVFRQGDAFDSIYAIRSGSVKTYQLAVSGAVQITGFYLPGDLIGFDAISSGQHPSGAETLDTTTLCALPFHDVEQLSGDVPALRHQVFRLMSKEIVADSELVSVLSNRSAEERLAALLLSLSVRYALRGFSAREFRLCMSRNDIANYLGLAVETVSRLFTRFQERKLIAVEGKFVRFVDLQALRDVAGAGPNSGRT